MFMLPLIGLAIIVYIISFALAPPVDIDGIREPLFMRIILLLEVLYQAPTQ